MSAAIDSACNVTPVDVDVDEIRHVPPSDPRWRRFVLQTETKLFQSDRWASLIGDFYGWEPLVAIALRGGEIVGGTPYMMVDDFRGRRRITYPFSDVCDSIGTSGLALAANDGVPWRIRARTVPRSLCPGLTPAGVHQSVALPADPAKIPALWHPAQVQNARRMESAGGKVRRDVSSDALGKFYELLTALRRSKFHLLPQPRRFFDLLAERYFPENGFVAVAEIGGCAVAAAICLLHGDTLYVKYVASDQRSLHLRPNNYLFAKLTHLAVEQGCRFLDLGISASSGLAQFKKGLGAQSEPYYAVKLNERPASRGVAQLERTLAELTTELTKSEVPASITQGAGNLLYRYFV